MKIILPPNRQNQRTLCEFRDQLLIIGANGAGKTRFTDYLIQDLKDKAFCLSALDALYGGVERPVRHADSIDEIYENNFEKANYERKRRGLGVGNDVKNW